MAFHGNSFFLHGLLSGGSQLAVNLAVAEAGRDPGAIGSQFSRLVSVVFSFLRVLGFNAHIVLFE
jgi:hypothetical protein